MTGPFIISVLSQKGGVGKSTISRLLGVEFARMDGGTWDVKIADLDVAQGTSFQWMQRRAAGGFTPEIRVEAMRLDKALKDAENFHVMVLDCAGYTSTDTARAAKASTLIIVPCGVGVDDLQPTVGVLRELQRAGVSSKRLLVVLTGTQDSEAEIAEARTYITDAGFKVAPTTLSEKTLYRRGLDVGLALSEVKHKGLAERAQQLFADMIKPLESLAEEPVTNKENAA